MHIAPVLRMVASGMVAAACLCAAAQQAADWTTSGGDAGNQHYSALTQINRTNVAKLAVAWTFDTGEAGGLETTPLEVDGVLYAMTPSQKVIALDAVSGHLLWTFAPGIKGTQPVRGLSFWRDGTHRRLLVGITQYLYALDPATGRPLDDFGKDGRIDLRDGLGGRAEEQSVALTSPGVVYRDLIIVGGRVPETYPAPPGDIRAYDVRTGALRWTFHTLPHPGEFGYSTWLQGSTAGSGAANNWAGMAVDTQRGVVYVPTGSAVPDFYGGNRAGDTLFANTLLALDASTGRRLWHFQGVHHDLWDRDFPAAPVLMEVQRDGRRIPAVGQTTKQGLLFVFDRRTGKPLFPVDERAVAPSTVPGEAAARTQPFPSLPAPFAPQVVTEATLTTRTPEAHAWALQRLKETHHEGPYVPLRLDGDTVVTPSFEGGAEWGGPAVDPRTQILYVNANAYASLGALVTAGTGSAGRRTYLTQCALCHGAHREGAPPEFPSLLGVTHRLSDEQIVATLHNGRGRMPAMPVTGRTLIDLLGYLRTDKDTVVPVDALSHGVSTTATPGAGYTMTGYRRFNDPDGYPATAAPWGTLSAINLRTGAYLWQVPLGQYPELVAKGLPDTGSENYGGPVVTAGGLIFIAATNFDHKIRAFHSGSGTLLWEAVLPFAGNATPVVYERDGREFLVIAAGGSSMNPHGKTGGVYVAFALPGR